MAAPPQQACCQQGYGTETPEYIAKNSSPTPLGYRFAWKYRHFVRRDSRARHEFIGTRVCRPMKYSEETYLKRCKKSVPSIRAAISRKTLLNSILTMLDNFLGTACSSRPILGKGRIMSPSPCAGLRTMLLDQIVCRSARDRRVTFVAKFILLSKNDHTALTTIKENQLLGRLLCPPTLLG